jgi:hypothetical protein
MVIRKYLQLAAHNPNFAAAELDRDAFKLAAGFFF